MSPSRTLPLQHHQNYYGHHPPPQSQQHSHSHRSQTNRRTASSGSDLLQTKLRRLLNTDNKDLISSSTDDLLIPPPQLSPNSPYYHHHQSPKNYQQQLTVHPEQQSDVNVFFPSAFLSPQSLPLHPTDELDDLYSYGIDDDDNNLILTDNYRPISPPAEYAQKNSPTKNDKIKKEKPRYDYQRSYSHHQTTEGDYVPMSASSGGSRTSREYSDSRGSNQQNINSHKSLPDLHTQISRHSPHSEALSCCSRGNRSNRSAGSSFNRDSGGSSGHYTHRSEPCCKQMEKIMQQQQATSTPIQDYRRDSGSSTQHSGNSYYAYGNQQFRYDCIECRAKMRADVECLLNFPTPEVPEAFQDDYQDDSTDKNNKTATIRNTYYNQKTSVVRSPTPPSPQEILSPRSGQNLELSPPLGTFKRQKCLRFKNFRGRYSNTPTNSMAQTSTSQPNSIQCIEDDRRPILRSKSDISDRYWNRLQQGQKMSKEEQYHNEQHNRDREQHKSERSNMSLSRRERYGMSAGTGSCGSTGSVGSNGGLQSANLSKSESMYELEHFFDRLGLNDEKYAELIEVTRPIKKHQRSASATVPATYHSDNEDSDASSAVFFSDVSTVDSNRIIQTTIDQTHDTVVTSSNTQGPQNTQTNLYRPSEPPSIVERNARIIKWLCNCKKLQLL